ncbi:hypothetical protein [Pantoea sp. GL120224-02]|uniref:hypothetical protein n=1 Tax=Pantoea sp. GL120224-02 TaxID=1378084 RepID=UPI000BCF0FCB|nr:hypothetical protein [Pantoea sp. GL120224-02]SNY70996.1 hypothetical protein SAMN02744778_03119 [Pantoea sp. GL120224-02]
MLRIMWEFVRTFKKSSKVIKIDLYEWHQSNVMMQKLPDNPQWTSYANFRGEMSFSLWNLAHAVVKTDYLIINNFMSPCLGFLLSGNSLLKISANDNIRLIDNINSVLNDVSLTSYTGRLGQGLTIMLAHHLGYRFVGHLASDPYIKKYNAHFTSLNGNKKSKVADFLFEDHTNNRAIIESKASSTLQTHETSFVKRKLKEALTKQVIPLVNSVTRVGKGYASHSALRGFSQPINSSISYVDPPSGNEFKELNLDSLWVKRKNYSAWFALLSYFDIAKILYNNENGDLKSLINLTRKSLRVTYICGKCCVILRWEKIGKNMLVVAGVEYSLMRSIESLLQGNDESLLRYSGIEHYESYENSYFENVSFFPDGTFVGQCHSHHLERHYENFIMPE